MSNLYTKKGMTDSNTRIVDSYKMKLIVIFKILLLIAEILCMVTF